MKSLSPSESRKLAELAEANCMADFCRAAPPDFTAINGLHLEQTGSYTAMLATNIHEFDMYNRVFALGVGQPTTEEEVDHLVNIYGQAGLPFLVRLSPDAQPSELPRWLEVRGLALDQAKDSARFYLQPTGLIDVPHSLHIQAVGAAEATDFAQIACIDHSPALQTWLLSTIGRPGWHHYIAIEEGTPLASGVLYIERNIGWLGWAVTLPAHRRKGVQQALLVHRLNEAARMGCVLISAETRGETPEDSNPSFHNLRRVGFHMAYLRLHYHFDPFPLEN